MASSGAIQIIAAQNERTTMRDMYRIVSLLVAITYAQLRAMEWSVLERVVDTPGRPLLFVAHSCTMPMADEPLAECGSEEERRTFFSIAGCVVAIAWNTAWLAHLVEGSDIELIEINFHRIKPVRKVVLSEGSHITLVETPKHTVLLLRSKVSGESLIADPTFAQYGFESGIETLVDYREHKVDMDCPVEVCLLGSATDVQAGFDKTLFSQAKTAITSRTAEKAIIDHTGDKEAFFNMDMAGFQRCQDEMAAIVYDKELEQQQKLEDALSDDYDEYGGDKLYEEEIERRLDPYAEQLLGLVDDCERV